MNVLHRNCSMSVSAWRICFTLSENKKSSFPQINMSVVGHKCSMSHHRLILFCPKWGTGETITESVWNRQWWNTTSCLWLGLGSPAENQNNGSRAHLLQTHGCIEHTSITFLLHKLLCIQKWRREQKLFFSKSLTRKLMGIDRTTVSSKHGHLFLQRKVTDVQGALFEHDCTSHESSF